MRVLHVLDHSLPLQSGYTFRTLKILQHQRKMGIETFHLTGIKQGKSGATVEVINGLTFYRTPLPHRWLTSAPVIKQWVAVSYLKERLQSVIKEVKPDVIHAHSPVLNGLAALKVAKTLKIPVVYEIRALWEDAAVDHGTHRANSLRYKLIRALESKMVHKAQHVTTICEGLKKELLERGLARDRITVIPNAVDFQGVLKQKNWHERQEQLLQELGLKHKFVLGFIGSFYTYEGLDILLEAVHSLKKTLPQLRVLLVGGGPQERQLRQKIDNLNLQQEVVMIGRVPHEEVGLYYELCDYCIFPRKKMRLTDLVTPLKPLEAMARGVPVLASNVGGHRELIQDQTTGFLFESDSVTNCAQAIYTAVSNSKPMEVIFKARNYVIEQRSWESSTQHYQAVYEKALSA